MVAIRRIAYVYNRNQQLCEFSTLREFDLLCPNIRLVRAPENSQSHDNFGDGTQCFPWSIFLTVLLNSWVEVEVWISNTPWYNYSHLYSRLRNRRRPVFRARPSSLCSRCPSSCSHGSWCDLPNNSRLTPGFACPLWLLYAYISYPLAWFHWRNLIAADQVRLHSLF